MRYVWLDLIRWVLASGVFFYHSFEGRLGAFPGWDALTRVGGHGILPFFVISGLAITLTLTRVTPIRFVTNRIRRLVPSLVFVAVLQLALTVYINRADLKNFSVLQTILRDAGQGILPLPNADGSFANFVTWTIAVEVRFYALALLVLVVASVLKKKVDAEFITIAIGTWIGLLYLGAYLDVPVLKAMLISMEGPYFALGAILGLSLNRAIPRRIIGLLILFVIPLLSKSIFEGLIGYAPVNAVANFAYISGSILLIFLALHIPNPKWKPLGSALPLLGQASYPLYLLGGAFGMMLVRLPYFAAFDSVWTQFAPYLIISFVSVAFVALLEPRFFPNFFGAPNAHKP